MAVKISHERTDFISAKGTSHRTLKRLQQKQQNMLLVKQRSVGEETTQCLREVSVQAWEAALRSQHWGSTVEKGRPMELADFLA